MTNTSHRPAFRFANLAKLIAATALAISPLHSNSLGIPVIDGANLAQNSTSAYNLVLQYAKQLLQYKEQLMQTLAQIQNLRNQAQNLSKIANIKEQMTQVEYVINTAKTLSGQLENSAKIGSNFNALYGAGNYGTWESFYSQLSKRKAAGDAVADNLITAAKTSTAQISTSSDQLSLLQGTIAGVGSPTEAGQATAAAVSVVAQQMQAMMGSLSAMNAASARAEARTNTEELNGPEQIQSMNTQRRALLDAATNATSKFTPGATK